MTDNTYENMVLIILFIAAFSSVALYVHLLKVEVPRSFTAQNIYFATTKDGRVFQND